MFDLTENDIKKLIKKCKEEIIKNQDLLSNDKIGNYTLEYLVECGLKYIYGDLHYKNNVFLECKSSFKKSIEQETNHQCDVDSISIEINLLRHPGKSLFSAWSNNNLAFITDNNRLHAYFRNKFMFDLEIHSTTSLDACASYIVAGTINGDIAIIDPLSRSINTTNRHTQSVTVVKCIQTSNPNHKKILSASDDGSIYLDRKIQISNRRITFAEYINDNQFACVCENDIIVTDKDSTMTYSIHKNNITQFSYNSYIISSDTAGKLGILNINIGNPTHNIYDFNCTNHVTLYGSDHIIGFGNEVLQKFNLHMQTATTLYTAPSSNISCATYSKHFVAFTTMNKTINSTINFLDMRSNAIKVININQNIINMQLSDSGEELFVVTDEGSLICDICLIN